MKRPTMPPMKATGRNTAISDRLVARTARPDLLGALDRRLPGRHLLLFHEAEDVFQHHHRVVDHDAHRQRQGEQRDDVEREAHVLHGREGGDERAGDRHRRDERRPEAAQEQPHDERGEDRAEDQVLFHRVDGGHDELRLVADDLRVPALRELALQLLEALLDRFDHLDRVGARLLADLEHHGRLAAHGSDRLSVLDAVLDAGHVAHPDWCFYQKPPLRVEIGRRPNSSGEPTRP